jgi:hypothetical protein
MGLVMYLLSLASILGMDPAFIARLATLCSGNALCNAIHAPI